MSGTEKSGTPKILWTETVKSGGDCACGYCGGKMAPGEEYLHLRVRHDGRTYDWNCHASCRAVALRLNVENDLESGYGFQNRCFRFCRRNICRGCGNWNGFYGDCEEAKDFCADRVYEKLFGGNHETGIKERT